VTEDERIEEEKANEDVEAHGAKEIAGVGLAAAALIGAGAAGVKMATDDDGGERNVGHLLSPEARFAEADKDRDGYVTQPELGAYSLKFSTDKLKEEGIDVSEAGLSVAGYKLPIELIGKHDGFPVEGDTVMLKQGVSEELDKLAEGSALEWTKKIREADRDGDGYASQEELGIIEMKMSTLKLKEEGYEVSEEELAKAEYKVDLSLLGEGGFMVEENMIFLKYGLDDKLDALIKGEG
jgi:hypothetical protein